MLACQPSSPQNPPKTNNVKKKAKAVFSHCHELDLQNSHVLPALIRKFVEAKENKKASVEIWGSTTPKREFLYVDDMADACLYLMENFSEPGPINVGTGQDLSIADLARLIMKIVKYQGELLFDASKPDGTARKLLDVSRLSQAGWQARTRLIEGIQKTLAWFLEKRTLVS